MMNIFQRTLHHSYPLQFFPKCGARSRWTGEQREEHGRSIETIGAGGVGQEGGISCFMNFEIFVFPENI
jgi:hypothetical protein